jgi:hypothetical protein
MHNPKRCGQCVIIDQDSMNASSFGHIEAMAANAVREVNKNLIKDDHRYYVHNTETNKGDKKNGKDLELLCGASRQTRLRA